MKLHKKITGSLAFLFLAAIFFTSCSDDKDKDPVPSEVESIILELEKSGTHKRFAELLKQSDLSNCDTEALTLFAFPNEALNTKAVSSEDDNLIKRHIVKGKYTKNDLKKETSIQTIGGDKLEIETDDQGEVYLNGIRIGAESPVSKSIVFKIENTIPEVTAPAASELYYIIKELNKSENHTQFVQRLNDADLSAYEQTSMTLFAFPNEALNTKAVSSEDDKLIKRHIVEGKYTKNELKELEELRTIGGDKLEIETNDQGEVYLNGIRIGAESPVSKSMIYDAEEVIPAETGGQRVFHVLFCHADYENEANIDQSYPVEGISINVYDSRHELVTTLQTDPNGRVTLRNKSGRHAYYVAEKKDEESDITVISNLKYGWEVIGIFTSREEIDAYPPMPGEKTTFTGDVKYKDINGDGIIDDNDKIEYCAIPDDEEEVTVYVTNIETLSSEFFDIEGLIRKGIPEFQELFESERLRVDRTLSLLEQRQAINSSNALVKEVYAKGYQLIALISNGIKYVMGNPQLEFHYKKELSEIQGYRAAAYHQLSVLFGGLGLRTENNPDEWMLPRATLEETNDFIRAGLNESQLYPNYENSLAAALFDLHQRRYPDALRYADKALEFVPGDLTANLIKAEANLLTGNLSAAAGILNPLNQSYGYPPLEGSVSGEAIRANIKQLYLIQQESDGLIFFNKVRWEETVGWPEKYRLLPIPFQEMMTNPAMIQNPGW